MQKSFIHNQKGYTLIEVLVGLLISTSVLLLLVNTLGFSGKISAHINAQAETDAEAKRLSLYLQKQILKSKTIVVKNNQVYLEDLENNAYYNFYDLNTSGLVFRNKVSKSNLLPIAGGRSQVALGVKVFGLYLENGDSLRLDLMFVKKDTPHNIRVRHAGEVIQQ